jgi:hypothetical protein
VVEVVEVVEVVGVVGEGKGAAVQSSTVGRLVAGLGMMVARILRCDAGSVQVKGMGLE